jgi:amino acid permease
VDFFAAAAGAVTYVGLTQQVSGPWLASVLQLALLLFCFGFLVVYLVS